MVKGLWGKKVGMTQVFTNKKVVPVTVIDISNWFVTNVKTVERDGYQAVQIARVRDKYAQDAFSTSWLKTPNKYFYYFKEVKCANDLPDVTVGQPANFSTIMTPGDMVDVVGTTKGHGFAGAVRRHGFAGAPASHGSKLGNRPGSMSFMRSQGRVIKGKRLPGHHGVTRHMVRNLEIIRVEEQSKLVLVKGAVPGKSGSLVFLRKA